jgi:LemA protein
MAIGMIVLIVVIVVVLGLIIYTIAIYNGLIRLKNNIKKSWANIDVLLKQRSDELPKLISSVKGYMKHEKTTLAALTKARTAIMTAKTKSQKAAADDVISGALKTIFAVAENYPKLRANENFLHLQSRISGLENELADRREFYNDSANTYNIRIHSFPDKILAGMMKYTDEDMFKASAKDKKDVKVRF